MIKFHCPHCEQKLGVPDEYAGRRVRCSKCSQACQVPAAETLEPVPSAGIASAASPRPAAIQHPVRPTPVPPPADVDPNPATDHNPFGDLDLDSLTRGPDSEALSAARRERQKQQAKSIRGSSRSSGGGSSGTGSAAAGLALGAGKIPLSLAVSLGFMIGICIIWTVVGYYTNKDFFIFPIAVAAAGASGLVVFTEKRNAGLGLLAIGMALFGILIGKCMIAKWVLMPKLMQYFSQNVESQTDPYNTLSAEEQQELFESDFLAYGVGTIDLWKQGEFEESIAQILILGNIARDSQEEGYEEEDTSSDYPGEHEAVCAHVKNWAEQDRKQAFEKHFDTYLSVAMECIKNSDLMKGISFIAAFMGAFSLWDLIIIPISLAGAWKIGTSTDSAA